LIIEGGNLVSDGEGGLFLCESVFEHNPDVDDAELSHLLSAWFGVTRVTLLPSLPLELTGHADIIVKVAEPDTLIVTQAGPDHPWHDTLEDACRRLAASKRGDGGNWTIHRMPMAAGGQQPSEWAYTNALTINDVIIAPSYDTESDKKAAAVFAAASPNRRLCWVDYRDFPVGAVHCQSKEIPA
jgi:agmatine/peptidylarginine deiminase